MRLTEHRVLASVKKMTPITRAVLGAATALALTVAPVPAFAVFTNGGFESGDFTGWTVGGGSNNGLSGAPPFTGANVIISGTMPGPSSVVGAVTDPRAPGITLPRAGTSTAKMNDEASGAAITTLTQAINVTNADIDPGDGLPHIRFSFAPVLEDPGHSPDEQPYFFVQVRNLTTSTVVYEQFAYSGQPGVAYLTDGTPSWKYLNFQNVDVTLPASAIGQQLELTVVAADCALGGHGGYVYVDGFGSAVIPPGGGVIPTDATSVPVDSPWALGLLAGLLGFFGWRAKKRLGA